MQKTDWNGKPFNIGWMKTNFEIAEVLCPLSCFFLYAFSMFGACKLFHLNEPSDNIFLFSAIVIFSLGIMVVALFTVFGDFMNEAANRDKRD